MSRRPAPEATVRFEDYLHELRQQPPSVHIELDPAKEAAYMEEHAHRFKRTLAALPSSATPLRILDIGTTPFTLFLKQAYPQHQVCTLDRTDLLKERCRGVGIELRSGNLEREPIPFDDDSFDVVIFTEVLEHVFAPPSDILREVRRILKPAGKLILSVPNIARLANRLKLFFGGTPLVDPDEQMNRDWVHGHGHLHEYTRGEIAELCRRVGFTVLRTEMISASPLDVLRGDGRFRVTRFAYHSLAALVPGFRFTILVECRN